MNGQSTVNDQRTRPSTLTRFVAAILVCVMMLSMVAMIIGNWYRSTILNVEWYEPIITNEAFQTVIKDTIVAEVSKEIGQTGIFASFLTQTLQNVLTNERIEKFLEAYMVQFVDYLNDRSATPLPTNAADMFQTAFLMMAQEAVNKLGVPLPDSVEQQIRQMASTIGEVAEQNIDMLTRESFVQLARLEKSHRIMLLISRSTGILILALVTAVILLLLLFLKNISRFFSHAFFSVWLAGAAIGIPLMALHASDLTGSLVDAPTAIKPVLENLITFATDQLKQTGLTLLAGATIALAIVLGVRWLSPGRVH